MFPMPRIGKTMLARNLAYEAVSRGVSTRYTSASDMLAALGGLTGSMLTQRLRRYTKAALLVVDELGYLRYDSRVELVKLEGKSYRAKEAASLARKKRADRKKRPPRKPRANASK